MVIRDFRKATEHTVYHIYRLVLYATGSGTDTRQTCAPRGVLTAVTVTHVTQYG